MEPPADLRGVIDPRISIGRLVEEGRPAAVHQARARAARRAEGPPGFVRDAFAFAIWGAALMAMIALAKRFRPRPGS